MVAEATTPSTLQHYGIILKPRVEFMVSGTEHFAHLSTPKMEFSCEIRGVHIKDQMDNMGKYLYIITPQILVNLDEF